MYRPGELRKSHPPRPPGSGPRADQIARYEEASKLADAKSESDKSSDNSSNVTTDEFDIDSNFPKNSLSKFSREEIGSRSDRYCSVVLI